MIAGQTDARPAGLATIRRAVEADAGTLRTLLAAMSDDLGHPTASLADTGSLRRHGFGPAPLFRALLAEAAGAALGMTLYFPEYSTLRGQPGVYVQDLYVARPARAAGLGRRLLAATARDARDWGAAYLRLSAHGTNANALAFYRRLGFLTDPEERILWVDGAAFDALEGMA